MRKSDVHESLATLYLRLNGYFTTGLILHSPEWGQARTEIDCLAIRHCHHSQADRAIGTAEFLAADEEANDLILCEVKSEPTQLRFNKPIRNDPAALCAMLRWAGLFGEERIESIAGRLLPLLQDGVSAEAARHGVREGDFRVRALLCCPPIAKPTNDRWCLTGDEILAYARQCFRPDERRASCSTRYNFQQWGFPFAPIVRLLKEFPELPTLESLYQELRAT